MMDFLNKYKLLIIGLLTGLIIGLGIDLLLPQNPKDEQLSSLLNINETLSYSKDDLNLTCSQEQLKITDPDCTVDSFNLRGSISYYLDLGSISYTKDKDTLIVTFKEVEQNSLTLNYNTSTVVDEIDGLITLKEARIRLADYEKIEKYFSDNISTEDIFSEAKEELHKQAIVYINNRLTDMDLNITIEFE